MKKDFRKIVIVALFSGFILGGCSFNFSGKKTEIKLEQNKEDSAEVVESNIQESREDNSENISEKKTEEKILDSSKNISDSKTELDVNSSNKAPKITNKLVSWGFSQAENRKIDTIIIHSSYNAVGSDLHNLDDIIYKEYKPYDVSPHYIISREGKIYRLVEDKNIAYHAGESKVPDGRTSVNNFSIGIEIVNTKSEKPNSDQYSALKNLVAYLKDKYKIKYTLGHSDIAPGRKDDPWNFDWNKIN